VAVPDRMSITVRTANRFSPAGLIHIVKVTVLALRFSGGRLTMDAVCWILFSIDTANSSR